VTNINITAPTSFFKNRRIGASRDKVRERKVIWLVLPTVVVLTTLFVGGFVFGILQSVGFFSVIADGDQKISFDAYIAAFQNETVRAGIILTFRVAILSTVLSTVIALAISLMISRTKRFQSTLIAIAQFNIPIPHVVAATGILLTFSQSGIVSRLTNHFGITDGSSDFPIITNDPFGYGIIMSYLWKEIPFLCVLILSALRGPVTNLDETAKTLGASYSFRLRKVILPYIFPSILSGTIIVFAFSFGSYEVPYLLGEPYPSTVSVVAYQLYTNRDLANRPTAMALATITSVVIGLLVYAYMKLTQQEGRKT
jgi:putative spermidine/putrescine transport system permease protein